MYTSFRNGTLSRYLPGGVERTEIAEADAPAALADIFGVDRTLYVEAAEVKRRHGPTAQPAKQGRPRRRHRRAGSH